MKTMAQMLASLALLVGCEMSHGGESNSSGSNWLRCKKLSECGVAEAVACSDDGYCLDQAGARIESQRSTLRPSEDGGCAWGVDEALAKVDVSAPQRNNCGDFSRSSREPSLELLAARDCFDRALGGGGRGAEFNINRCFPDCFAPTYYVAAPDGQYYGVLLDHGLLSSDERRKVRVESCSAVTLNDSMTDFECVDSRLLYSCNEPTSVPRGVLDHRSVEPYKLTDPPSEPGATTVPVHLHISNQSFEVPLVYIRAHVDGVTTVQGDFPVDTQHTWIQFDLELEVGSHKLSVTGRDPLTAGTGASLSHTINVSAERWVVVNYWANGGDEEPMFTLTESDTQVGFE